jgi:hypothetical protein
LSEEKSEKEEATVNSVNDLISAVERHTRNIESFAEKGLHEYIKNTVEEMLRLLSELRGAVYMGNL